nr:immunoglobulin heavy chain junction region [Macaca mulatta]MOV39088.1 immunoglobulin heavy chain junction region [Macaca mulatta]
CARYNGIRQYFEFW